MLWRRPIEEQTDEVRRKVFGKKDKDFLFKFESRRSGRDKTKLFVVVPQTALLFCNAQMAWLGIFHLQLFLNPRRNTRKDGLSQESNSRQ